MAMKYQNTLCSPTSVHEKTKAIEASFEKFLDERLFPSSSIQTYHALLQKKLREHSLLPHRIKKNVTKDLRLQGALTVGIANEGSFDQASRFHLSQ